MTTITIDDNTQIKISLLPNETYEIKNVNIIQNKNKHELLVNYFEDNMDNGLVIENNDVLIEPTPVTIYVKNISKFIVSEIICINKSSN